jgi:hypothetical protein
MSLDEFNRVTTGMTYDQVVEVVGGPGEQQSHFESGGFSSESYKWSGQDGISTAMVQFQNGKVSGKFQFGLR